MIGIPPTFASITLLVILGLVAILGGRYARHNGHLQSKGAKFAVITVIVLLAVAAWVGPAMFLAG